MYQEQILGNMVQSLIGKEGKKESSIEKRTTWQRSLSSSVEMGRCASAARSLNSTLPLHDVHHSSRFAVDKWHSPELNASGEQSIDCPINWVSVQVAEELIRDMYQTLMNETQKDTSMITCLLL